ncbi:hypothetical protein X975_08984, partial [Stegodyphus mimosarum]
MEEYRPSFQRFSEFFLMMSPSSISLSFPLSKHRQSHIFIVQKDLFLWRYIL